MLEIIGSVRDAIIAHARKDAPREACGLLVKVGGVLHYRPCRNVATGTEHFVLPADDYCAAEDAGDIVAVVHSHPNAEPRPSMADRTGCEASGLPWLIIGLPSNRTYWLTPSGYRPPLTRRPYVFGLLDCYSVIRDWFAWERGIALPDFERHEQADLDGGLYEAHFAEAGFAEVSGVPQVGDCFLMQVRSDKINHAAVYVGGGEILHHLYGQLSRQEPAERWQKFITHHLRYRHA